MYCIIFVPFLSNSPFEFTINKNVSDYLNNCILYNIKLNFNQVIDSRIVCIVRNNEKQCRKEVSEATKNLCLRKAPRTESSA